MTRRPERLKATKTYGLDKPKTLQENEVKSGAIQGNVNFDSSKLKPGNFKVVDKEVPKHSFPDMTTKEMINKQEDGKKTHISKIQSPEKKEINQEFNTDVNTGLPKGFVTRSEMERRISKRKPLLNQTDNPRGSENKIIPKGNVIPAGFVTRKDMEARLKNRTTKSTKVTPMYTDENNLHEKTDEKQQIPSLPKGRGRDTDKPDPKAKHIFSKLEKRTQVLTTVKEVFHPKERQIPKQNKIDETIDEIKVPKVTQVPKDRKPPLAVKKSDEETAAPKTNTKAANKDKRKNIPDTNDPDRMTSASTRKSSTTVTPRMTSTAIPKAPRQNAKTSNVLGMKLESVKILVMNANGKDDKSGTPAERRKNAIQNVVMKHMPNLVLFQEFSWVGITGKTWAKYPIPEHFVYKGHYDASIMYDSTCITVQDLPASDIDTIVSGLQSNANNRLKRTFPMDFNPVARMSVSRVTASTTPGLDFICISWHGRSNENGGGKMKELKKIEYFEYWMEFLRNIREKYKLPMLAAGDYNVDMYSIKKCVQSPFKLCIYEASMRRTLKGIVDFCIVTDDLDFTDITWVNLERDTTVFHPNGILDHDPFVGSLTVSALGASATALGIGKKKSWPSPIAKSK